MLPTRLLSHAARGMVATSLLLLNPALAGQKPKDWAPAADPANFVSQVDNPYFPLSSTRSMSYSGVSKEGTETLGIEVTGQTKVSLGVTTTAVVEKSQENKKSGEWERVIGKDNSDGLLALLRKDYRTARTQFEKGLTSDQAPFKRAAEWGMALVAYDTGDDAKLDVQLEAIAKSDPAIGDKGKAKDELTRLNAKLTELRKEYK